MGKMQREKGARWEREVAIRIREACPGFDSHRGAQAREGADAPDVTCPGHWVEAKAGSAWTYEGALKQAMEAAPPHLHPVVIAKRDRRTPVVVMALDDWLETLGQWWRECGSRP